VGGLIAEAVYMAASELAQKGGKQLGEKLGVLAGTSGGPLGMVVGGVVGGTALEYVAEKAVDAIFNDKVEFFWMERDGLGMKAQLASRINAYIDNFGNQNIAAVDALAAERAFNSHLTADLQQRFTNAGFLNTGSSINVGVGGLGLIRGQLIWTNSADLDLHLILPGGGGEVSFRRTSISFNGGTAIAELDHDNLGGLIDAAPNLRVENIAVTGVNVPAGSYGFFVHNFNDNGNGPTSFKLVLTGDAAGRFQTHTGVVGNNLNSPTFNVQSPGGTFVPAQP